MPQKARMASNKHKASSMTSFKETNQPLDGKLTVFGPFHPEKVNNLFWKKQGDFPGGPAVKTPRSQCRGPGFDPWLGN